MCQSPNKKRQIDHSSASESEPPCVSRANNNPSSPPTNSKAPAPEFRKKKEQGEARKENDARPVGARRPRYAASGDVGEGEGGTEPNERSYGAEVDDVGECEGAKLYKTAWVDVLPAPVLGTPTDVDADKGSWRCGVVGARGSTLRQFADLESWRGGERAFAGEMGRASMVRAESGLRWTIGGCLRGEGRRRVILREPSELTSNADTNGAEVGSRYTTLRHSAQTLPSRTGRGGGTHWFRFPTDVTAVVSKGDALKEVSTGRLDTAIGRDLDELFVLTCTLSLSHRHRQKFCGPSSPFSGTMSNLVQVKGWWRDSLYRRTPFPLQLGQDGGEHQRWENDKVNLAPLRILNLVSVNRGLGLLKASLKALYCDIEGETMIKTALAWGNSVPVLRSINDDAASEGRFQPMTIEELASKRAVSGSYLMSPYSPKQSSESLKGKREVARTYGGRIAGPSPLSKDHVVSEVIAAWAAGA
ncbi:hypothetical protein V8E53_006150 [Lactarius tabidus]